MKRRFLTIMLLLVVANLLVAVQLVRRGAAVASTQAQAATHETPQAASPLSRSEIRFPPSKPPRCTRVEIRLPDSGFDLASVPKEPPAWIRLSHEAPSWGTSPCALDGFGPVLVLRHYLAEKQWASLSASGKGPVLARYEIIDAGSLQLPYPFPELFTQREGGSYLVTAILYWADLASSDRAAPLATYLTPMTDASGAPTTFVQSLGPRMTRVHAQWMVYEVRPKGARMQQFEGRQRFAVGEAGWVVTEHPRLAGEGNSRCGQADNIVPVYDLSISRPTS